MIEKIKEKIIEGIQNVPIKIISVVVFGSLAKGKYTIDSDIDLLVVANNISDKRNRRHQEIVSIKSKIYKIGLTFDILLLNSNECISNFRNHNPLFLDIAEEGIIIWDKENLVDCLIKETKEYIIKKKIKKIEEGWEYPIIDRIPTCLSKVSNKDFALAMLNDGKRDFEIGRKLTDDVFYDKAVYHFQQSIEKAVKAVLICFGVYKKTHFIGETLLNEVENRKVNIEWKEKLITISNLSIEIEPEITWSRYPSIDNDTLWIPYEEYTNDDALGFQEKRKSVVHIAENFIDWWFR